MDERAINERRHIIARNEKNGKVKAAAGMDENGNIQTVEPDESNISNLLNVSTYDTALESFFKKMLEQSDDPAHTGLYVMTDKVLNLFVTTDLDPKEREKHRVKPPGQFEPLDVTKIDRADMKRKGISWESIKPHLRAMSYHNKSHGLIDMNLELEPGVVVPMTGRVSLQEQADGSIKVIPHYFRQELDVKAPVAGIILPDHIQKNLTQTGHGGELVELKLPNGKVEPCYVSVDKLTNTVEYWPKSEANFTNSLKGVELTEAQIADRDSGKRITLEKYTTNAGYFKDGHIQPDAANRNYEWSYDGLDPNRYKEENKQIAAQKRGVEDGPTEVKLIINPKIKGQWVPEKYLKQWEAADKDPSLRPTIEPCYLKGMKNDPKGEPYNAWVVPRWDLGDMKFYVYKPSQKQIHEWGSQPALEGVILDYVPGTGKTKNASKEFKELMKQGQQTPTEKQKERQRQNNTQAPGKGKDRKRTGPKV